MSTPEPTASMLLQYRLGERLGNCVWKAEDTRTGKAVAVKLLARQLPKDPAKREALIRAVRLGGAIYHSSIVNIVEIVPAGDALILVMELVEGQTLASMIHGTPFDRQTFFRIAYQLADAVKLLQAKELVHGAISPDSILVTPAGQAKLGGFNLATFLQKREGMPSAFQARGGEPRAVAYMAPEQITGQASTPATDIFALGLVMFEMATGRQAFQATTAADLAHKIVGEQPPNPKSINPNIDSAVLNVTGKCLFKDPFRRYPDAKSLVADIVRADATAEAFATEVARAAVAPSAEQLASKPRNSILFIADIENYTSFEALDPGAAAKAAARMQQILGEAVYLFDGEVLDPFGPTLIAELPSVESALETARKAEFDVSPEQQEGEQIPIRMLLHAGDVTTKEGQVSGAAVTKAFEVLSTLPPLRLFISEDFARRGRGGLRLRDSGARAGVKLYEIVPAEPAEPTPTEISTAEAEAAAEAEEAARQAALAAAAKKKRQTMLALAVALIVIVAGATAIVLMRRPKAAAVQAAPAQLPPATAATPRKIYVKVDGGDPALAPRAPAIRAAALEIFHGYPEVRVVDAAAPDVTSFTEPLRGPDAATAIQSVVQSVSAKLRLPARTPPSAEALNAFTDAVAAMDASDKVKSEAAIRAATKADPNFLPAQIAAMRFFDAQAKTADAVDAAKKVQALDPLNADAARRIARADIAAADVAGGITSYGTVLKTLPRDVEALNMIGRYACAVPDADKFTAVTKNLPAPFAAVHPPDLLLATGRIDQAVGAFYEIESRVPNNAALSLKIGRIAVLRHSTEIAEVELKKLQTLDPAYAYPLLKAYMAAAAGSKAEAAAQLHTAQQASAAGDDFWTSAAEVAALLGDARGTLDALEKAAARKEPTASYVLSNPLFKYLQSEPRFAKVREALTAEQNEIRSALANVTI